jgi:8-oxo-dGTP pyrophosphatase MutT (NUDIX family)
MLSKQPKTIYLSSTVSLIQESHLQKLKNQFTRFAKTITIRGSEKTIIAAKYSAPCGPTAVQFQHQLSNLAYMRGRLFEELTRHYRSRIVSRIVNFDETNDEEYELAELRSEATAAKDLHTRARYAECMYDFYTQLSERQFAIGYHPMNSAPQFHYMLDVITGSQFTMTRDLRTTWAGVHVHAKGQLIALETLKYKYTVPGGSGKVGERPIDSAVRELIEETGLHVFSKIASSKWNKVDVNWVGNGIDLHITLSEKFELGFSPGKEAWHMVWYKGVPPVNTSLHRAAQNLSDLFWTKCRHDKDGRSTSPQLDFWFKQTKTKILVKKFLDHYDALDEYGTSLMEHYKCIPQILTHIQRT